MNLRLNPVIALFVSIAPAFAHAHFIWAVADPVSRNVRIEVAESPGESVVPILGKLKSGIKSLGLGSWTEDSDHMHLRAPLTKSQVGTVSLLYGLHGDDLVTWWAKATTNLSSAGRALGQTYELTLNRSGQDLVAKLTKNGKPVSGAEVEAYGKGIKAGQKLSTGKDGTVRMSFVSSGILALGATVIEPVSGVDHGKPYKQSMHLVSLTVQMGAR